MSSRKELQEFFQNYDPSNKAHVRTLEMLAEGIHSSTELSELEELSGMDLSKIKRQTDGRPTGELADATFDESPGYSFDASRSDISSDLEEGVKRVRTEGGHDPGGDGPVAGHLVLPRFFDGDNPENKSSENDSGFCIPGLEEIGQDNQQAQFITMVKEPGATPAPSPKARIVVNKPPLETVFYKSIFIPTKASDASDSPPPRDPAYLFLPLQCKLCGLRFRSSDTDPFGVHIEEHRRKTRALDEKAVLRREFFTSKTAEAPEKLKLNVAGAAEVISWDRESPNCVICGDPIKKVWRDDVEEWVLDSGTRVDENEFVHRGCAL